MQTILRRLGPVARLGKAFGLAAVFGLSSISPVAADSLAASVFGNTPLASLHESRACDRWALAFDNDFLVPGSRDQDYTYGVSLLHIADSQAANGIALPLQWVDQQLGLDAPARRGIEFGLYGFTPENIQNPHANTNDRPYASLVYAATRSERVYPLQGTVISSQLTLGVLGLDLVGDLQKGLHSVLDSDAPRGWRHQVSDGGEPTLRYSLARQQLLSAPTDRVEIKHTQSISVGYISEASWGLNFRSGHLNSLWHNFHPEQASYAETSAQLNHRSVENFFWAGIAVKARLYNVFLQGQWRNSAVEYASDDLRHLVVEAWAGYTHAFANGFFFSYGLRGHSAEIRGGDGDRNVIWGGLMLGHNLE